MMALGHNKPIISSPLCVVKVNLTGGGGFALALYAAKWYNQHIRLMDAHRANMPIDKGEKVL
jgi:hypothetical protein